MWAGVRIGGGIAWLGLLGWRVAGAAGVVWSAELCAPSTNQPDVCQQEPDGARVLVLSFFFKVEINMNT